MTDLALPVISAAKLSSSDPEVHAKEVAALGKACREVGFFYVNEHGISPDQCEEIFECAREVFKLPLEEKLAVSMKRSKHNRGYVGFQDQKLNEKAFDAKEAFDIGNDFAPDHPDVLAGKPLRGVNFWPPLGDAWKAKVLSYQQACLKLARTIHQGFSEDLDVDPQIFAKALETPIINLRLLHYPGSTEASDRPDAGAGTHTDYGNLTILATDEVAGLEVQTRAGQWIEAPHLEGAFVCNIGDCLMRWTNDTYVSTPHRVRLPKRERYSVPFFLEADPDVVVDPRTLRPSEKPHYPPITCGEYLGMRLDKAYDFRKQHKA